MKPDTRTAMRDLIGEIRRTLPFDAPEAQVCGERCDGCSLKLLEYLGSELEAWDRRLDDGERPGLKDLSQLIKTARKVQRVIERNGITG